MNTITTRILGGVLLGNTGASRQILAEKNLKVLSHQSRADEGLKVSCCQSLTDYYLYVPGLQGPNSARGSGSEDIRLPEPCGTGLEGSWL